MTSFVTFTSFCVAVADICVCFISHSEFVHTEDVIKTHTILCQSFFNQKRSVDSAGMAGTSALYHCKGRNYILFY